MDNESTDLNDLLTDSDFEPEVVEDGSYTFAETVTFGQDYVDAYNAGTSFTMIVPIIEVPADDVIVDKGITISSPFGFGLAIGGSFLLIAAIVGAILFLRRS